MDAASRHTYGAYSVEAACSRKENFHPCTWTLTYLQNKMYLRFIINPSLTMDLRCENLNVRQNNIERIFSKTIFFLINYLKYPIKQD